MHGLQSPPNTLFSAERFIQGKQGEIRMNATGDDGSWLKRPIAATQGWLGSSISHRVTALTAMVTLLITACIAVVLYHQHSKLVRERIQREFVLDSNFA